MLKNIMTVDLEDYFCDLPFNEWSKYESRIEKTVTPILEMFERHKVLATFFVVGYFAEKFPALIKQIHDQGHELSSHTYAHIDLRKVSKEEFKNDLLKSIQNIESITNEKVLGFRAPYFSVDKTNVWVIEILKTCLKYDSSIFPVKTSQYGFPKAPKEIYHPAVNDITKNDNSQSFIEIPPLTYQIIPKLNIPIAGGFYFRFFPYFFIKKAITNFNKSNKPAMIYIHPKDLDPEMPKIPGYSWHYYYGKKNIKEKFEKLLRDFRFSSVREIFFSN